MSWYNSPDGNAPRNSELPECADCTEKVTCDDERTEFGNIKLCSVCYEIRLAQEEGDEENYMNHIGI